MHHSGTLPLAFEGLEQGFFWGGGGGGGGGGRAGKNCQNGGRGKP